MNQENFNGVVWYRPDASELRLLHSMMDYHFNVKPNFPKIISENTSKKYFLKVLDYTKITEEVEKSFGWTWVEYSGAQYLVSEDYINSLRKIIDLLKVNQECFLSLKQARDLSTAIEEHLLKRFKRV